MLKEKRQQSIRNLIRVRNISNQSEFAEFLSKDGFFVTQSSISRDLDELGIVKVNGFYALPQVLDESRNRGLLSLETAGEVLIVARCEPGLASAVAVRIDNDKLPEIVGTIAGDDTIFIAVKDARAQKAAIKKIWEIFNR